MEKGIQPSEIEKMDVEDLIKWMLFVLEREKIMMQAKGGL